MRDAVQAYICLAEQLEDEKVRGEAFNFSPESPLSVLDVVAEIGRLMECDDLVPDIRGGAQSEIRHQHLSAAKSRQVLSWRPQYNLSEALSETIEWYREFIG